MSKKTSNKRKTKKNHPSGRIGGARPSKKPWQWVAVGLIAAAATTAISLVLVQANGPESLSFNEMLRAGGHLHALAVRPVKNGSEILLGTHNGLYVSGENGKTWHLASERTDFMAFAGSPDERVFYAGGHDIAVLRSVDGGKTWEKAGKALPHHDVHALGADPADPNRAYAWVVGRGLFRTNDAGKTWKLMNSRLARVPITTIVVRRNNPSAILASSGAGILSSKDGGASWQPVRNGLWGKGVFALLEIEGMAGRFLAGTEKGLHLSTDSATRFARVEEFLISDPVIALAQVKGGGFVYALTNAGGLYRSEDGGQRWVGLH